MALAWGMLNLRKLDGSLITYYTYLVGLKKVSSGCQGIANDVYIAVTSFYVRQHPASRLFPILHGTGTSLCQLQ